MAAKIPVISVRTVPAAPLHPSMSFPAVAFRRPAASQQQFSPSGKVIMKLAQFVLPTESMCVRTGKATMKKSQLVLVARLMAISLFLASTSTTAATLYFDSVFNLQQMIYGPLITTGQGEACCCGSICYDVTSLAVDSRGQLYTVVYEPWGGDGYSWLVRSTFTN